MDLIVRTRKGFPAIWERGGGFSNTGEAVIVASPQGTPPKAVYIKRRGPLACAEHALIPIRPDMYVIRADHHREDFHIEIFTVTKDIILKKSYVFDQGEWDQTPPDFLAKAIDTAKAKACEYHCRRPMYIRD